MCNLYKKTWSKEIKNLMKDIDERKVNRGYILQKLEYIVKGVEYLEQRIADNDVMLKVWGNGYQAIPKTNDKGGEDEK